VSRRALFRRRRDCVDDKIHDDDDEMHCIAVCLGVGRVPKPTSGSVDVT